MEFLLVAVLVGAGLFILGLAALLLAFLKLVCWLILLPFRLLIAIPVLLFKLVFGVAFGLVLLPVLAIGLLLAALATVFAVVLPLAPFVLLALLVWALARRGQPAGGVPVAPAR